jgi:tRNA(fMet)-specific endonuclease VapC
MNQFVLDTDILTLLQRGQPAVTANVMAHPLAIQAVTVISVEESLSGWYTRLRRAKRRDELAHVYQRLADAIHMLSRFKVLSFTESAMDRYDSLRLAHPNVGKNDLRIAAIVLENQGTLVTRNSRDFGQVPGLAIVDWSV